MDRIEQNKAFKVQGETANKPKLSKLMITVLSLIYIVIIGLFVYTIIQIPQTYQKMDINQIESVQRSVTDILNSTNDAEKISEDLAHFVETTPMELIVKKNQKIIFTTFPELNLNDLTTIIHEDATSFRQQARLSTNYGEYDVLLVVYPVTTNAKMTQLFTMLTIYTTILFVLFFVMIILLSRMLISPLEFIRHSIKKMKQFKFDEVDRRDDTAIVREFSAFTGHIADRFSDVSQKYTQLEYLLLMEKERLKQLIYMSRAYLHELKTPLHQIMLHNEGFEETYAENAEVIEVSEYNITQIDAAMLRINEILKIMNQTAFDEQVIKPFDFVDYYERIEEQFLYLFNVRNLLVETTLPDVDKVCLNKHVFGLILHNLLANLANHSVAGSDAFVDIEIAKDGELEMRFTNKISAIDALNLNQFDRPISELLVDKNSYSSGNGLRLTRELIHSIDGTFQIIINHSDLIIIVILPQVEEVD